MQAHGQSPNPAEHKIRDQGPTQIYFFLANRRQPHNNPEGQIRPFHPQENSVLHHRQKFTTNLSRLDRQQFLVSLKKRSFFPKPKKQFSCNALHDYLETMKDFRRLTYLEERFSLNSVIYEDFCNSPKEKSEFLSFILKSEMYRLTPVQYWLYHFWS